MRLGSVTVTAKSETDKRLGTITVAANIAMPMFPAFGHRETGHDFKIVLSDHGVTIDGKLQYEQLDNLFIEHPQALVWKYEVNGAEEVLELSVAPHYDSALGPLTHHAKATKSYTWKVVGTFSMVPGSYKGVDVGRLVVSGSAEGQTLLWKSTSLCVGQSPPEKLKPIPRL